MTESHHVLIMTLPEKGHINPIVGVAQHLVALGAKVSLYCPGECSVQLAAANLKVRVVRTEHSKVAWPKEHATSGALFAERSQDPEWLARWIRRLLLEGAPSGITPLREIIRSECPDVVVIDPMYYAAVIAAQCENVPWVGASSSLNPVTPREWRCAMVDTLRSLEQERAALFKAHGDLPEFRVCDAMSPWLNLVFTTEEYVSRSVSDNHNSFFVGPSCPMGLRGDEVDFLWEDIDEKRPLVYMSLGSQNYSHPDLFACVVQGLQGCGLQLLLALNDLVDSEFARSLPKSVIQLRYASQLAILDRASLVISHGGANTVMETLCRGLPLVLLPLVNDQPLQGKLLEQSGAGLVLDPANLSPPDVRQSVLSLLAANSPVSRRAAEIGHSYRTQDGAKTSAKLIMQLAQDKEALIPVGGF